MFVRFAIAVATASLVLATVQSSSAAGPRYHATILQSTYAATVAYAEPHAINDNGIVAGNDQAYGPATSFKAAIWDANGTPTLLSMQSGATYSGAADINAAGTVIGGSGGVASVWSAANVRSNFAGYSPIAINNAGQILTASYLYTNGVASPITGGTAAALSDTGIVVGTSGQTASFAARLTPNPVSFSSSSGLFTGVNDSGQMVGRIGRSIVRVSATGTTETYATAASSDFNYNLSYQTGGINDRGVFVGWTGTQPPSGGTYLLESIIRGMIFQDGAATDLSTLIDDTGTWIIRRAFDINNRGQIVAYGIYDPDGSGPLAPQRQAVRLDPIRLPGDTNYDNVVNFADLVTLAQNYNRSGNGQVFYESGDFNYDWKVDFADLVTLAQHYQGGTANVAGLTSDFAADWALAQSLVPEPTMIAMIALAGLVARRRRLR